MNQKIIPALWFEKDAMDAAEYYIDIFPESSVFNTVTSYDVPSPSGYSVTVRFKLCNQDFVAIDGAPEFKTSSAVSLSYTTTDKDELNRVWYKLMNDGYAVIEYGEHEFNPESGWVRDRYGIMWQLSLSEKDAEQRIKPTLLFSNDMNSKAEEAAAFYTEIFANSNVNNIVHYGKDAKVSFTLSQFEMYAMDDDTKDDQQFNEAVSLMVMCEDQAEINYLWEKLSAVKESEACGWLKDNYGVSWQIVPRRLDEMYENASKEQNANLTDAILEMKKLNLETLEEVYSK